MRKRVAEVENFSAARFPLISTYDLGLYLDGTLNGSRNGLRVTSRHHRIEVILQILYQSDISDNSMLHDFGHPIRVLGHGKRFECAWIGADETGLVKRPDQIFSPRMIDPHLAAHAGVHLRQ